MSKAQGWVLAALLLTALIALAAKPQDAAAGVAGIFGKGNVKATFVGKFVLAWVVGLIALVLLADATPVIAGWIATLILLGAILTNGPKALANVGVKA